ncbi:hypothetical protein JTE90_010225 [Oedothorax gibbosus]|uniref:G-protein coupled receptors family 3 profile domain-containing protein n=1 Tax=Oedothorax gibbosus TaxID=931172 RepID=A0AAV6UKY3_9ARAC|nr:hypothetical protein JTE90_010225 [Oedothorax gibbosus]
MSSQDNFESRTIGAVRDDVMVVQCDVTRRTYLTCLILWTLLVATAAHRRRTTAPHADEEGDPGRLLERLDAAGEWCSSGAEGGGAAVRLPLHLFDTLVQKVDLVARVIEGTTPHDDRMLQTVIEETVQSEPHSPSGRLVWLGNGTFHQPDLFLSVRAQPERNTLLATRMHNAVLSDTLEWMTGSVPSSVGNWTSPYFQCEGRRWMVSYTKGVVSDKERLSGVLSVDVDVGEVDVNQCDRLLPSSPWQMDAFLGTHRCHNATTTCVFSPGFGWSRGSYRCECRAGFYSATGRPAFNGTLVEAAYRDKITLNSPTYDMLYICKRCQPGCDTCEDDSPCLANYNWAFRISLLTISVVCISLTLLLSFYVYRYRKLKVINVASPVFLCITLLGCVIMYCEMAAIFPVLSMSSCIATKWTRHMGFCLTYSALLLKTWRVSLTYRVKSAHKLKLTDKQLLQWLFPILLVMCIYLGTWTVSAPPRALYIRDWEGLKFKQCDYNWWDHSLAIGEFLFLLWGIRVCYNVRNAESVFNEAKHISWAVHSITVVNIIMVMIHLVLVPDAGPDVKYLFGFVRTQLSTTVTVVLIFGPKFYRVLKGEGDVWDNRARARGVTASFSLNGVGPVLEEPQDLYQENEELKEEVQKLASQIEFMKIVHMEVNNRHLKPKHGGFFSQPTNTQRSVCMRFDAAACADSPGSRVSPAAELISEKV